MIRLQFIISFSFLFCIAGDAQTCCSGGVPISSNIGFQSSDAHNLQIGVSGDFNFLKTLKSGNETLDDNQRLRTTQSYIIRGAYSVTDKIAFEILLPLVRQTRKVALLGGSHDRERTFGIGDPLALILYNILNKAVVLRVGAGPQFPLGDYDQKNARGLTLLEDLQPGSGAWDLILFSSLEFHLPNKFSSLLYINTIISRTGSNSNSRGGLQTYQFGNDIQIIGGFNDQVFFLGQIMSPGLSVRYRHADRDEVDHNELPGTGGDFLFAQLSNSFPFPKLNSNFNVNIEIPIWTRVNDTQLAPSYRLNFGWFKSFGPEQENAPVIDGNQKIQL